MRRTHPVLVSATPLVLLAVYAAVLLRGSGVESVPILRFGADVLLTITVPGVLGLRLLVRSTSRTWLEDLTFGSLFGYVLQLPVYLLGLVVGVPLLPAVAPVVAVTLCLAHPRRRELLRPEHEPAQPALIWGLSAVAAYLLTWSARYLWAAAPLTTAGKSMPQVDRPYHLAIVTELRHHFPPQLAFVDGQPLHYHWFMHAHVAATSWLTGIDPLVLLMRLWMVPVLVLIVFGTALVTSRLAGRSWPGLAAAGILVLVGDFDPYAWTSTANFVDERFMSGTLDVSPTQPFATALLLLVVFLAHAILTGTNRSAGTWTALALSTVALSGAKATFVPIVLAGFVAVAAVQLVRTRRVPRAALGLVGVGLAVLVFGQVVIFGGESQAMYVDPLHLVHGIEHRLGLGRGPASTVFVVVAALVAWVIVPGVGMVGLLRSGAWRDDRAVFLAGAAASGVGAALVFGHPYFAEAYFSRSTPVFVAVLSAWGLGELVGSRAGRQVLPLLIAAAVGGAVMTEAVQARGLRAAPPKGVAVPGGLHGLVMPYLVLAGLLAAVLLGLALVGWRWPRARVVAPALAVSLVLGLSLGRTVTATHDFTERSWDIFHATPSAHAMIGAGGLDAASWLERRSAPDDLVATNAHRWHPGIRDNRAFWIAAFTRRHVLVEGWGYAPPVLAESARRRVRSSELPFWDPALLAMNDAAFRRPSAATVDRLRAQYGVRWLFLDDRFAGHPRELADVADLRYHRGDYWVYELPAQD